METGKPLRVLHLITRLIVGGAQQNTLLTVRGLRDRYGLDVLLVTGPPLGPEGSLMEEAERWGIRPVVIQDLRREIHAGRDASALWKILRTIEEYSPDVVHTHSSKAGILGRFAASIAGVPGVVHTIHGLPFHPYESRLRNALYLLLESWMARQSDRIVTVGEVMRQKAIEAGLAWPGKFSVVRSGLVVEGFTFREDLRQWRRGQLGIPAGVPVVGEVGRLAPLKGQDHFQSSSERILRQVPETMFLLVGEGMLRGTIEQELSRRGLRDRFFLTGLVDPDDVPGYLSAMDVVVHPSLREGLPRVAVEALLCQRPVVAFDIDGAREVVQHGQTGFLVPPGREDLLADRVVELLKNPSLRLEMGQRGREALKERYSWEEMVRQIYKVYLEVLGRAENEQNAKGTFHPHA